MALNEVLDTVTFAVSYSGKFIEGHISEMRNAVVITIYLLAATVLVETPVSFLEEAFVRMKLERYYKRYAFLILFVAFLVGQINVFFNISSVEVLATQPFLVLLFRELKKRYADVHDAQMLFCQFVAFVATSAAISYFYAGAVGLLWTCRLWAILYIYGFYWVLNDLACYFAVE